MRMLHLLALGALLAGPVAPAPATPAHAVIAFYNQYWTAAAEPGPQVRIQEGEGLRLANLDPFGMFFFSPDHTITEIVEDAFRQPRFDSGQVPIGDTGPVLGVETLPPGEYPFYCLTHGPAMNGTLIVLPS